MAKKIYGSTAVLLEQKGYVSRELLISEDNSFIDLVHWEALEDAKNAQDSFMQYPNTKAFQDLIDLESINITYYKVVKEH